MGLDMYAWARSNVPADAPWFGEGFQPDVGEEALTQGEELYYWRKHPDLHRWFEALAMRRGFTEGSMDFNGVWLRLSEEDLKQLESDVDADALPENQGGFFFGASVYPEDAESTIEFIQKARAAIAEGHTVFYSSSW